MLAEYRDRSTLFTVYLFRIAVMSTATDSTKKFGNAERNVMLGEDENEQCRVTSSPGAGSDGVKNTFPISLPV